MNQSELYQELVESLRRPGLEEGDITPKQLALDSKSSIWVARGKLNVLVEECVLEKCRVFNGKNWIIVYRVPKK